MWVLWLHDGTHNVSMKCSTLLKIKMFYFQSNFSSPSPIYWTHKGGLLDVLVNFPDSAWQCQFHPSSTQYSNLDSERRDSGVENKPVLEALCKYLSLHIIQQNLFIFLKIDDRAGLITATSSATPWEDHVSNILTSSKIKCFLFSF